jgi:hypothetical protein
MQEIRTNNDTEGWHTRLHKLAGLLNQSAMNMYSLIELLHHDVTGSQFKYIYNDNEMRIFTMVLLEKLSKVHQCANFILKKNVDDQIFEPDDSNFD